jgi:uncharacterized membrane protein YfhO
MAGLYGWRKKEILRADFNLRAVVVPQGKHEVKFIYQPQSFKIGLYLSGASLVMLALISFGLYRFKKEVW